MRDVAQAAGVSPALVSIVFREVPGASPETRRHVLSTAKRLGYVRDERARGLRSGQRDAIGITFRIDQPFQAEVVAGLYEAVPLHAHPIVLSPTSRGRDEEDAIADLVANRCGVLIVLSSHLSAERLGRFAMEIPVISVARAVEAPHIDWVACDEPGGMALAVEHLHALGHRRMVYLSDDAAAGGKERRAGFDRATGRLGIARGCRVLPAGSTEDDGAEAAERLLGAGNLPTAILGFNDRCALGAIDTLIRAGVGVPQDVSVAGFDDSPIAARRMIQMTSVRQDPTALARIAVERALMRIGGDDRAKRGTVVPTSLTIRSTTAPPPSRH